MAPPLRRPYASLLLASVLLLSLSFSHAARGARNQAAAQHRHGDQVDLDTGDEDAAAADERCGGGGGGGEVEECLMRRTLVAHTDYIYTQGGNHN